MGVKFDFRSIFEELRSFEGNAELSFETARIAIVGHERTGKILLSHAGYNKEKEIVSCISIYDPKKIELVLLYVHHTKMKCVSASVPWDTSLLGLIVQTPTPKQKNGYEFQPIIVDLRVGRLHEIESFNTKVQRLQFVYTSSKGGYYYFLLFVEKFVVQRWKLRMFATLH